MKIYEVYEIYRIYEIYFIKVIYICQNIFDFYTNAVEKYFRAKKLYVSHIHFIFMWNCSKVCRYSSTNFPQRND